MAPTSKSKKGPSVPATPQMSSSYQSTADLPGLYPVHDGSYGVNTLLNLDSAKKKGKKTKYGFANEDAEDKKFKKQVKKGGKQYGMESDLKKVVDQSKKEGGVLSPGGGTTETNLGPNTPQTQKPLGTTQHPLGGTTQQHLGGTTQQHLGGTTQQHPGGTTHHPPGATTHHPPGGTTHHPLGSTTQHPPGGTTQQPLGTTQNPPTGGGSPNSPGASPSGSGTFGGGSSPPSSPQSTFAKLVPSIPKYMADLFTYQDLSEPQLPYEPARLTPANPNTLIGNSHPFAPRQDHSPFYGMPSGVGGSSPIPSFRPDSSRSFTYESGLFGDASFSTKPTSMPPPPVPPYPSNSGGYANNQVINGAYAANASSQLTASSSHSSAPTPVVPPATGTSNPIHASHYVAPGTSTSHGVEIGTALPPVVGLGSDDFPIESINTAVHPTTNAHAATNPYTTTPKVVPSNQLNATNKYGTSKNTQKKSGANKKTHQTNNDNNHGSSSWRYYWRMLAKIPVFIKRLMLSDFIVSLIQLVLVFLVILVAVWGSMSLVDRLADESTGILDNAKSSPSSSGLGWPNWGGIRDNIVQYIPTPSIGRGSSIFSGNSNGFWEHSNSWSTGSKTAGGKSGNLVKDLKNNLPEKVYVEVGKNGKPIISQDFWHAFRDQIMADDFILTLEEAKSRAPTISDKHWRAVKSRIEESGFSSPSAKDDDSLVQNKLSQSWENWIRQNDHSLKQLVGGIAVTKDQFVKLFKSEAASYQTEIRAELDGLQGRIQKLVSEVSKLREAPTSPGGMTRQEVTTLVEAALAKAISSAKLDAVASGRIRGHLSDMMFNQVNFLSIGSGAAVDPGLSSQPWQVPKQPFKTKKWFESDGYVPLPPKAALMPWSQEGECFCAAPNLKGYGQGTHDISVLISRTIIPQHLVVEHILPESTLDPGAMPRDIELWAYFEELNLRNELKASLSGRYPNKGKEQGLPEGWVMIGQFTYQNKHHGDGVQVFKVNDEVTKMRAVTGHIVVRAINNYGADHTCFYRLRLYGEVVEDKPPG